MEQLEDELMAIFNCDSKWPVCLFDFTYKNRIPTHFCFKVEANLTTLVVEDYFFESFV